MKRKQNIVRSERRSRRAKQDQRADITPLFEFSKRRQFFARPEVYSRDGAADPHGKLLLSKSVVLIKTKSKYFRVENSKGIPLQLSDREFLFRRLPKKNFSLSKSRYPEVRPLIDGGIVRVFPIVSHGVVLGFFGIGKRLGVKSYQPMRRSLSMLLLASRRRRSKRELRSMRSRT